MIQHIFSTLDKQYYKKEVYKNIYIYMHMLSVCRYIYVCVHIYIYAQYIWSYICSVYMVTYIEQDLQEYSEGCNFFKTKRKTEKSAKRSPHT